MRNVAWSVFLAFMIGLALLTAAMFAFVLAVGPGECEDPSCLALQTYSPSPDLPATIGPETAAPVPPVVPASPDETGPVETSPEATAPEETAEETPEETAPEETAGASPSP